MAGAAPDFIGADTRIDEVSAGAVRRAGAVGITAVMEAMVAASIASLTVYDMIKSVDRWATIEGVRLEAKSGGKSGDVTRPDKRS